MAKRRSHLSKALGFAPAALALAVARLLPYRARLGFGGWLGRQLVGRAPRLRRRVEANLAHVLPELGAAERARIARAVGDTFGRNFMETFHMRGFQARASWTGPTGPGAAALAEAARSGRGVLIVTGHFGQWEAGRAWLKSIGVECAALYRPLNNAHLDRIYLRNLCVGGAPMFPKTPSGLRGLVKHVARGGVVAILTDQYERGARRFDFLGRPAPTTTFVADLALRYGIPLFPAFCRRDPDGEHVNVEIEAPIPHGAPDAMIQAINDRLAARIRTDPGQYYWLHRRWRKDLPKPRT